MTKLESVLNRINEREYVRNMAVIRELCAKYKISEDAVEIAFDSYEDLRASGSYNMVTDARTVANEITYNMNAEDVKLLRGSKLINFYFDIVKNYSKVFK